ncbi:hypothetical protein FA15DRAFT_577834, partial [Coprinopsis marcescibilis]
ITPRRNCLQHELMEALQMLKFSLRYGVSTLNFMAGTSKSDEIQALEGISRDNSTLPDDILTYLTHLMGNMGI